MEAATAHDYDEEECMKVGEEGQVGVECRQLWHFDWNYQKEGNKINKNLYKKKCSKNAKDFFSINFTFQLIE